MPVHHLMVGTWTPPGAIFTVAFDDEKLTLELVKRTEIPVDEPISWMAFDHAKKNIYGSAMKKWSSYAVKSPGEIVHEASHPMNHDPLASSVDTNTRAIFLLPAKQPPYAVYCNPFYKHAGHGSVFTVSPTGALETNSQNYEYQPNSGIHGMVFDPTETYLYSADLTANKLWVHRKDPDAAPETGAVVLVGSVDAPDARDHPRWVAMHPTGNYLYALMEKGNRICEYVIDPATHMPVYTNRSFPLIPPGIPDRWTMYRADVCALSFSGEYMFASSRSNSFGLTGYVAAFKLGATGSIERQICLNPTPTSGGHSNAVAPCDWSDEWVAITDDQEGWIEIYRWQDEFLARVARLRIPEPGFGMNAIWYD
ncbi:probable carboxy-cis,cis-muconate cyclase [Cephalotrichum gorgonifer]|uniref:Probable carboxy-cis,cis-muconate cyclase n=1 Tax=Cephalotrichum gorgonifer TaxID=2041049 RepID=A0AAE8N3L5_9PEZI|nr:probable carboxy-cis,cis-muconate cyclase [Cephalotrichum gorgonifer]